MTAHGRSRRAWWRLALGLGFSAAVGACSSGGPTLFQRIGALARTTIAPAEEAPPAPQVTRAQLQDIPYAIIALSKDGGPRAFLVPSVDNDGYVNYRDTGGDAVVMFGGAVSGTQSLGYDLRAVRYHRLDPVAHATPLADWPGRVQREYQFAVRDLGTYSVTLDCVFTSAAREVIEIVELRFDVFRVSETCTDARRQVTNTYWVDPGSGFIWKSEQWLGPEIGPVTVEIVRPYAG